MNPQEGAPLPLPEPDPEVLVIAGPLDGADVPEFFERLQALACERAGGLLVCELGALVEPDIGTVGALARLQLAAARLGYRIEFLSASRELQELLAFAGLEDVVPCALLRCEGESEEREERLGVEEGIQRDDLAP